MVPCFHDVQEAMQMSWEHFELKLLRRYAQSRTHYAGGET